MAIQTETIQVTGIRCERCVMRLGATLRDLDGLEAANANLIGRGHPLLGRRPHGPRRDPRPGSPGAASTRLRSSRSSPG